MFSWTIEYTTLNDDLNEPVEHNVERHNWRDTLDLFIRCVENHDCTGCKVTCYLGGIPYPTADPVVLEYRPT